MTYLNSDYYLLLLRFQLCIIKRCNKKYITKKRCFKAQPIRKGTSCKRQLSLREQTDCKSTGRVIELIPYYSITFHVVCEISCPRIIFTYQSNVFYEIFRYYFIM